MPLNTTTLSAALALFLAAGATAQTTTIDTTTMTLSGDGVGSGNRWHGSQLLPQLVDTAAGQEFHLYVLGDLNVPAGRTVLIRGSRPLRIVVGGDATVGAGTTFDASAVGRIGHAGGPDGGLAGAGGTGGAGTPEAPPFGTFPNQNGAGGAGGQPKVCLIDNGGTGGAGNFGQPSFSYPAYLGESGLPGSQGGPAAPGFGRLADGIAGPGAAGVGGQRAQWADYFDSFGGHSGFGAGGDYFSGGAGGGGGTGDSGTAGYRGSDGGIALGNQIPTTKPVASNTNLFAGNSGAGGSGGGGGGGGSSGMAGTQGGGGGGGGATTCVAGGRGGNGGLGGNGGAGARGSNGGNGGDGGGGGGAFEIASLGRLTFAGSGRAMGGNATFGTAAEAQQTGGAGKAGAAGSGGAAGNSGSGSGGRGGDGGRGGNGGSGGVGGNGGWGTPGGGGTVRLSAAELVLNNAAFNTSGGIVSGYPTLQSVSGWVSMARSTLSGSFTTQPSDTLLTSDGPMASNPFFHGAPMTRHINGLEGGGAIAGRLPDHNPAWIIGHGLRPANAVAALVRVTSVFGNNVVSPERPALALVNFTASVMTAPEIGVGASGFTVPLQTYGWANDPRFGGSGPTTRSTLGGFEVYLTMLPDGYDASKATMSVTLNGRQRIVSTSNFGAGSPLFVIVPPCPADLNSDTLVDDADFSIFVRAYDILDCSDPTMPLVCPSDLNTDGVVDDADFVVFAAAYNELLCP